MTVFERTASSVKIVTLNPQAQLGKAFQVGGEGRNRRPSPRLFGTLIGELSINTGELVENSPRTPLELFCWQFCWHFSDRFWGQKTVFSDVTDTDAQLTLADIRWCFVGVNSGPRLPCGWGRFWEFMLNRTELLPISFRVTCLCGKTCAATANWINTAALVV